MKFHRLIAKKASTLFLAALLCTNCVSQQVIGNHEQITVEHIAVLSADLIPTSEYNENGTTQKSLEEGRDVLDKSILQYFSGKNGIEFISLEKQETLLKEYNQDRLAQARNIGRQLKADAVLVSQIQRYSDRDGKNYSVKSPASLAFKYHLILTQSGQTLCMGSFDASQKPWLENLLSFKKTMSRGGKWIKGEDLALEAVSEKFNTCRYFKK